MQKFMFKILVLVLLISFSVEMSIPLLSNINSLSLVMDPQEADEKKETDKKEKDGEAKEKCLSAIKSLIVIEIGTDFYLKNDLVKTPGFLSLPEMPPDQA